MEKTRWSPHPVQAYVQRFGGRAMGPGADRRLAGNLGAWNLYWLSYPDLELHTDIVGGQAPLAVDPFIDMVLETSRQVVLAATAGDLASFLPPDQFIALMSAREIGHLEVVRFLGRDAWLAVMQIRADAFKTALRTECRYDLTAQENGTSQGKSTNMLPLVDFGSRSIH